MNVFLDGTPYDWLPVVNSPKFSLFDNSLNREILNSLRFHYVLIRFMIDREVTDMDERNMCFSFSTPK